MTQIMDNKLRQQVLQKVQMLHQSSRPGQCFWEMLQNEQSRNSAMITFDNLTVQLMRKILVKNKNILRDDIQIVEAHVSQQIFLCQSRLRLKTSKSQSLLQQVKNKLQKSRRQILGILICCIIHFIGLISSFMIIIRQSCDFQHSHIHQLFLLDTIFIKYPLDVAKWSIQCGKRTYWQWLIDNEFLLRLVKMIQPYVWYLSFSGLLVMCIWEILAILEIHKLQAKLRKSKSQVQQYIQTLGGPLKLII